jgi:hypothetical protein
MLLDAISINESNVEARIKLGTLIHVFGSTHLKDLEMAQKQEQTRWL